MFLPRVSSDILRPTSTCPIQILKPFGWYCNPEAFKPFLQSRCYSCQLEACNSLLTSKFCFCNLGSIPTHLEVQGFLLPSKFCSCHLGAVSANLSPTSSCCHPTPVPAIWVLFLPSWGPWVPAPIQTLLLPSMSNFYQPMTHQFLLPTKNLKVPTPSRSYSCHLDPTSATTRLKDSCSRSNFAPAI